MVAHRRAADGPVTLVQLPDIEHRLVIQRRAADDEPAAAREAADALGPGGAEGIYHDVDTAAFRLPQHPLS